MISGGTRRRCIHVETGVFGNTSGVINKQESTSMTKNSSRDDDDKAGGRERRHPPISSAISRRNSSSERKEILHLFLADLQQIKRSSITARNSK
ncbi:hypothetical protein CDAR_93821 [Caerostris darwini]|uniref:Uncharacterized protein n=1 Tax=Caerostris darwini TaxID=1538125 RepID=A0AAV4NJV9_9ARAC|nr:hypothetical protein CDAR_93821 [Caerostris darwini]